MVSGTPPKPPPLSNPPMKILYWNCGGAGNPHFVRHFKDLLKVHQPHMVVISETRVNRDRADDICKSLGLPIGKLWIQLVLQAVVVALE